MHPPEKLTQSGCYTESRTSCGSGIRSLANSLWLLGLRRGLFCVGHPAGERGACGLARPSLKGDLLFAPPTYHWLLASNAALRLAWLHKLVPRLRRSHGAVLGFALLEVYR